MWSTYDDPTSPNPEAIRRNRFCTSYYFHPNDDGGSLPSPRGGGGGADDRWVNGRKRRSRLESLGIETQRNRDPTEK
jgi:hypothetical protein